MVMVYWRELFCQNCKKETKHRYSSNEEKEAFTNPNLEWECWACKTKKRESKRKAPIIDIEEGAFVTFFVNKHPTAEEAQKDVHKTSIDALAQVASYLEDRIGVFEKMILGKTKPRAIRIKDKSEAPNKEF